MVYKTKIYVKIYNLESLEMTVKKIFLKKYFMFTHFSLLYQFRKSIFQFYITQTDFFFFSLADNINQIKWRMDFFHFIFMSQFLKSQKERSLFKSL